MQKRILRGFLALALMISMVPMVAFADESVVAPLAGSASFGGAGTNSDPFIIETEAQLREVASLVNDPDTHGQYGSTSVVYKLAANLDLSSAPWIPIGGTSKRFEGTFNGNGHVLSGMFMSSMSNSGLFGRIDGGCVYNLGLENIQVSGRDYLGGIAGETLGATISNCYVTGAISGGDSVGGIAGSLTAKKSGQVIVGTTSVTNCYTEVEVSGTASSVGGIAGFMRGESTIQDCYSVGSVASNTYRAGGIVGNVSDSGNTIEGCVALNPSISIGQTDGVGRIWGVMSNANTTSRNFGLDGMEVTAAGTPIALEEAPDKKDGGAVAVTSVFDTAWWADSPTYTSVWATSTSALPTLMGEVLAVPEHLAAGVRYAVSFDTGGGSSVENQLLAAGEKVVKPADPTKQDVTFAGWFKDSALTTPWIFDTDLVAANTTLYAKWAEIETPQFSDCVLSGLAGRVTVAGKMSSDATLEVNPVSSGSAYQALTALVNAEREDFLGAYDVKIVGGSYEGKLTLTFSVGTSFNGATITVRHLKSNGVVEVLSSVCQDGKVSVTVDELSTFMLTAERGMLSKPAAAAPLAKTGDNVAALFLTLGALALGSVMLIARARYGERRVD